ncbi:MAG: tetratricopeptide repeat protein [Spirochaetes bacterium]|nr:tetratricopeptide repeat protein [Spirochaetota bacterium]
MITYFLIFLFIIIITILALFVFSTYFFPRKLEEIADMIHKGQTKLAIKKLEDILAKDDRDAYAHYLLAEAYRKENNQQYAILEYRQVLKLGQFDDKMQESVIRKNMAEIFKSQKKFGEAKNEYLLLTKIEPDNFEHYFELGVIFFNANISEKSLQYFKKSASVNPKHSDSHFYMGQLHYRAGNQEDAKRSLMETIKLDPNNYKAHYFLGLVLRQQGDIEWAVKEFEVAQKLDDIKVKCFLAKGSCFLEKQQYPKAVIEFERGLKFTKKGSDTDLNLRYFLALSHENLRDMQSAINQWEIIHSVNQNFRDVPQKLRQNAEFRQDDRIKDFMIASLANFEHKCRKIVEAMGYESAQIKVLTDTDIEIISTDPENNLMNTKKQYKLMRFLRTTNSISEDFLRKLYDSMKSKNVQRIIVVTTGDFSGDAQSFSNTRPIELYGKSQLVELLKKVE